jgi:hypothetical protein
MEAAHYTVKNLSSGIRLLSVYSLCNLTFQTNSDDFASASARDLAYTDASVRKDRKEEEDDDGVPVAHDVDQAGSEGR